MYRALPDFYYWFFYTVILYHASTIAEFLNNIRWAIHRYLLCRYDWAYERSELNSETDGEGGLEYTYRVPEEIEDPLAQSMYWELMNKVRAEPIFREFIVPPSAKRRY